MIEIVGLHILLTYRCTFECDHCFVWGSPKQPGTFTVADIDRALDQAGALGTIRSVYFEGGEPFLFYPILLAGVRAAAERGFDVGIVTNGYWATSVEDAVEWLRPIAQWLTDLSVSSDLLHYDQVASPESRNILAACERLGIPASTIACEPPEGASQAPVLSRGQPVEGGGIPRPSAKYPSVGRGAVMFRGRAVAKFAPQAPKQPWDSFDECPHEDLAEPERVHLDPLGNLHLCQGLVMGNLFERPLREIVEAYAPHADPVVGPLLAGGPAEVVRVYALPHAEGYADACHLCYTTRELLRPRFPETLGPGQMYGQGLQ